MNARPAEYEALAVCEVSTGRLRRGVQGFSRRESTRCLCVIVPIGTLSVRRPFGFVFYGGSFIRPRMNLCVVQSNNQISTELVND